MAIQITDNADIIVMIWSRRSTVWTGVEQAYETWSRYMQRPADINTKGCPTSQNTIVVRTFQRCVYATTCLLDCGTYTTLTQTVMINNHCNYFRNI